MEKERYSRQRELIYDYLCSTVEHPSAEMIHMALKTEYPKLSLGTVYRNLGRLEETGKILRLPFAVDRFDANLTPHSHFYCEVCEKVYDVAFSDGESGAEFEIEGHLVHREIQIYSGVCKFCRRNSAQESETGK